MPVEKLDDDVGDEHDEQEAAAWAVRMAEEAAKEEEEAAKLLADAKILEEAGCFALVLEKIPAELAKQVSASVSIPTIGIGAGPDCDGQVLVLHDMLGITMDFSPRFLRRYLNLGEQSSDAIKQYAEDVRSGDFPDDNESYHT